MMRRSYQILKKQLARWKIHSILLIRPCTTMMIDWSRFLDNIKMTSGLHSRPIWARLKKSLNTSKIKLKSKIRNWHRMSASLVLKSNSNGTGKSLTISLKSRMQMTLRYKSWKINVPTWRTPQSRCETRSRHRRDRPNYWISPLTKWKNIRKHSMDLLSKYSRKMNNSRKM